MCGRAGEPSHRRRRTLRTLGPKGRRSERRWTAKSKHGCTTCAREYTPRRGDVTLCSALCVNSRVTWCRGVVQQTCVLLCAVSFSRRGLCVRSCQTAIAQATAHPNPKGDTIAHSHKTRVTFPFGSVVISPGDCSSPSPPSELGVRSSGEGFFTTPG